jgi:hypothetical protein
MHAGTSGLEEGQENAFFGTERSLVPVRPSVSDMPKGSNGPQEGQNVFSGSNTSSLVSDALSRSLYARDLRAWFVQFPRKQVLVLSTEQLLRNPRDSLDRIVAFLNVSSASSVWDETVLAGHRQKNRERDCALHPPRYTLHPTPYTLYPTPYALHPTTYTLHPTPYTLHPTLAQTLNLGFTVTV